jgi:hypothetical protein
VHGSGRSSPNSDGGEAVCGGGVDVTCGKEMDGTQFEFGNGGGLPPELRCPAGDQTTSRAARSQSLRSRGAQPRTDIKCVCAPPSTRRRAALDSRQRASGCGEPL